MEVAATEVAAMVVAAMVVTVTVATTVVVRALAGPCLVVTTGVAAATAAVLLLAATAGRKLRGVLSWDLGVLLAAVLHLGQAHDGAGKRASV